MSETVIYDRVSWASGAFTFTVLPTNAFAVLMTAAKMDASGANSVGLMASEYPPGFTATDQQQLLTLLNKLARETSKSAIDASQVYRDGQVYIEGTAPP